MVRDVIEKSQAFVDKVLERKKEEEENKKQLEAKKLADDEA